MKPGLARAVPMGILGIILGVMTVILIRHLQSVEPVWDAQLGIVAGGFLGAFFFIWGIGALDPKMSEHHAHEPPAELDEETANIVAYEEAHHEEEEVDQKLVWGFSMWTVSFWTVILFIVLAFFVTFGWFDLTISGDPAGSTNAVGYFTIDMGDGEQLVVSQLAAFFGVTIFTLFSLAVAAYLIGGAVWGLSHGIKTVETVGETPLMLTAGDTPESNVNDALKERKTGKLILTVIRTALAFFVLYSLFLALLQNMNVVDPSVPGILAVILGAVATGVVYVLRLQNLTIVIGVLYVLFWEVLIGLILPNPPELRFLLSVVNAVLIGIPLVYPVFVVRFTGKVAAWLAGVLRAIPEFLFQR